MSNLPPSVVVVGAVPGAAVKLSGLANRQAVPALFAFKEVQA